MIWANKLPKAMQFTAWETLILSKFMYGLTTVAIHYKPIEKFIGTIYYNSIKNLLGIKSKPNKEKLLHIALGIEFDEFCSLNRQITKARLEGEA